jgi:enoyl-CoA hydratase/carnithine racemase
MNQPKNALPEADAPLLHRRDARGVHVLTLNTPARFNVLGESMLGALESALRAGSR